MPELTFVNGTAVNGTSVYTLVFPDAAEDAWDVNAEYHNRPSTYPDNVGYSHAPRTLPFTLVMRGGGNPEAWYQGAIKLFDPGKNTTGIEATIGTVSVHRTVQVTAWKRVHGWRVEGEFSAVGDPLWRKLTATISAVSPVTVAAGNANALPVVTITPTTTALRRRISFFDRSGRGVQAYPVLITFDSTFAGAAAISNYIVFFQGRSVPFSISAVDTTTTRIWITIDIPTGGVSFADIFYGSSVSNSLTSNAWDDGGMNTATSSNLVWSWDDWNTITANPSRCGVWRPIKMGSRDSAVSFGMAGPFAETARTSFAGSITYANDANGFVLMIGSGAEIVDALTSLYRDVSLQAWASVTEYATLNVGYRVAGAAQFTSAYQVKVNSAVSQITSATALNIPEAVEVVVWVDFSGAGLQGLMKIGNISFVPQLTLRPDRIPTVIINASSTARVLTNTSLQNTTTGATITFTDLYMLNGSITIDCLKKEIGGHLYGTVRPSDRTEWFPLPIGSNAITAPTGATWSLTWNDRYRV